MEQLSVGSRYPALAGKPEGTFFDITEAGPVFLFHYRHPTDAEIADVSAGSAFEIRETVLDGILWILVRCGRQEWAEAPYHPALSKAPNLQLPESQEGYALTLLMVDQADQTIRHIRVIGLGNRFSRQLRDDVLSLSTRPFDQTVYDLSLVKAQTLYTTPQLARSSNNYFKLR